MSDGGISAGTCNNNFYDLGDGWKKNSHEWKRTKKDAATEQDGKTYWWCKYHVYNDRYDNIYMDNKPEDHDE